MYFDLNPSGAGDTLPADGELRTISGMLQKVQQYDVDLKYNHGPSIFNWSLVIAALATGLVVLLAWVVLPKRKPATAPA